MRRRRNERNSIFEGKASAAKSGAVGTVGVVGPQFQATRGCSSGMRAQTVCAVAALVVLAGCAGGVPSASDGADGTVRVYVSDDPGAIEEFDQLTVTLTSFSLRAADAEGEHDDGGRHRHHHEGNWTTYDINETTVDLTELDGANASLLHAVGVPDGEYTAVSVTVTDVNGTLTNGESATVKMPRDRLTIEKSFTVGSNESVNFVVDAVVRERKANESYVLKPNPDASGTDVEMRPHCGCANPHDGGCESHHYHESSGHHDDNHHGDDSHHGGHMADGHDGTHDDSDHSDCHHD